MTEEEIVLNKELFKAIGADTRIDILKALRDRQKTQTELAQQLKLSTPTVLEHLEQLEKAGLVQKLEEGRKWKYYKLTKNAERLLSRQRVHAVVLLAIGLLAVFGILVFLGQQTQPLQEAPTFEARETAAPTMQAEAAMPAAAPAIAPYAAEAEALDIEEAGMPVPAEDELNQTNQTGNDTRSS